MNARLFTFVGGEIGLWRVVRIETIVGESLVDVPRLDVISGPITALLEGAKWMLRGMTSNERYVTREEKEKLAAKQPGLGRPEASCAALIPVRKTIRGGVWRRMSGGGYLRSVLATLRWASSICPPSLVASITAVISGNKNKEWISCKA